MVLVFPKGPVINYRGGGGGLVQKRGGSDIFVHEKKEGGKHEDPHGLKLD